MPTKPKPRPVGRPKLHKSHAKSSIIPVRFSAEGRKRVENAAKASKQTISEWTRNMLTDFNLTETEWNKVLSLFGKARDEYDRKGNKERAEQCDEAIALAQNILTEMFL